MRTYSGFLLFEDVLDFVPTDNADLYQFVQRISHPTVLVVEEDCATTVGRKLDITYELEGFIELSTDIPLSKTRIETLLSQGIYVVAIRNLANCISTAGVCRKCWIGSFIDEVAPSVGSYVNVKPEFNFQSDLFIGTGATVNFTLTETDYSKALIVIDGVIQTSGFTITNNVLMFSIPPAVNKRVVVHYYRLTTQPLMGYLATSFSGSLLGMQPITTDSISIRPSLAQSLLSSEELTVMAEILIKAYPVVPSNYFEYAETISDKLERAIYICTLYGLYSNVTN